jgi:hypothetical protein
MPAGTFVVSTAETFVIALFMGSGPRNKFGTDVQDVSATGEKKWELQVAATWFPEYGMAPASDVIRITILGGTDPAAGITPGTPVEFDAFKVGVAAPEHTPKGGIKGGKPYYQAAAIRPAGSGGLRQVKSEQAS